MFLLQVRTRACVRNGLTVHHRSRTASRRHNEGLDAEAANEIGYPSALVIGREVALVPRQAKGRIAQLDYESIELRLWRQTGRFQVHHFNIP